MEYLFASVTSFDMYKTTKSLQVIKNTEYGIYGLVSANGFSEYLTGKDILGNDLTTSQRQASLSLGLAGILPTAIELTPASKAVTKDITKKAHERVVRNTQSARSFVDHWFNGLVSQTDVAMAGGTRLPINAMRDTHVQQEIHTSFAKVTKGTGKNIQIPSVRNNQFNKWFDSLSVDKFEEMWSIPHLRSKIEDRIRRPGGYHEWHLVARTPKFKQWGVRMDDIKDMRSLTKDVEFVNPPGRHGRRGSTKAHNEILKIIDSAPDYESFVRELNEWASKRMKNGVLDLPEGLRR
ncbi:hypothetical protein ACEWET_15095 [Paraliobacillus sp. JSM ZJ581]